MKKSFLLALFIILSCTEDDGNLPVIAACNVDNPIEELSWLNAEIRNRTLNQTEFSIYDYITQGTFDGETIFLYKNCNPIANSVVPIFNCEGIQIGLLNNDIPQEEIFEEALIWKNPDSACVLDNFED